MSKASQLRQRAQNFLKKGQFQQAIDEYKQLLSIESRNPNLYNDLGDVFLKAGDRIQAVSSFDKAVTNYEKVALYNNAVAVCKKILRVAPDRLDTIFKLGELRAKQKFDGEAGNYFLMFLGGALADPQNQVKGVQEKIAKMLELISADEGILAKAADLYIQVGLNKKAVELLDTLVCTFRDGQDSEKLEYYTKRLKALKSSMAPDDLEGMDRLMSCGQGVGDIDRMESSGGEVPPVQGNTSHLSVDAGAQSDSVIEHEASPPSVQDTSPDSVERTSPAALDEKGAHAAKEEAIEESEIVAAMDINEPQPSAREVEEEPLETHPHGQFPSVNPSSVDLEIGIGGTGETQPSNEVPFKEEESGTRDLAGEITSDVEEGDFKSHYDLGMAYIEMALYADAVKELQIASRSEQLQLKCIEMIGHCFLQQNSPRLAVKQLLRGLELAKSKVQDKLGIHYNLGVAYEMLGDMDRAREHYEEVYIVDVTFREVSEKIIKFGAIS
ncbi:MAG: tetratricopeptide repeat protein [Candidatus Krumholzibacteria bacterium]|nr:tetratricopeptide repeat protein [Candidatus Krumholzibacteria bacterium]